MRSLTEAIYIDAQNQKVPVTITWENAALSFLDQSYPYYQVEFEVGGNQDSLMFVHFKNGTSLYLTLNRENKNELLKIESQKEIFKMLFKINGRAWAFDFSLIAGFLVLIAALIYFRGPIAGFASTLIPTGFEKKMADKIFSTTLEGRFKNQKQAEEKLTLLVAELKEYSPEKYSIHLSSKTELNAFATIGGHIFINAGLIKALKKPEDLLGVVGHEMIHAKNRHVIKGIFQSAGLFLLLQTLVGDFTGIVAVLVDGGGPLLHLSYSRDLETEADRESVGLLLESGIDPEGLKSALQVIEKEQQKIIRETPGGEKMDELLNQNFLRSHPRSVDRGLSIQKQVDLLRQNSKYKDIPFKDLTAKWDDLQKAMNEL